MANAAPCLRSSLLVNQGESTLTIDAALGLGRGSRAVDVRNLVVLLTCGAPYMLCSLPILSPILLDPPQRREWQVSEFAQSLQSSAFFALCGAGGVVVSSLADRFGRKLSLQVVSLAAVAFGFGCAAATSFAAFAALRAALGFTVGGVVTCSCLLAIEVGLAGINQNWPHSSQRCDRVQNALAPGAASAVRAARSSGFRHRAAVPDLCDGAAASYRRCETPEVPRDFKTTEGAKGTRSRVRHSTARPPRRQRSMPGGRWRQS